MHAVLFDLDGTLTQTYYAEDNSYLRALNKQLPIDYNLPYWQECKHLTDEYVLHYFFQKIKKRLANDLERKQMMIDFLELMQEKQKIHPTFFHPIPGAIELIASLKSAFIPFGIATGGWEHMATFKLKTAGFDIDFPVIGSDLFQTKTAFTQELAAQLEQKQSRKLQFTYVGDSVYDYLVAQELNMQFIGVDFRQTGKLSAAGALKVLTDFKDNQQFLRLLHAQ